MSESLVRARLWRVLLITGLMFAALPAGSALADTTVGETGTPLAPFGVTGGSEDVQTNATMPAAGVVTSFQTQSSSCPFFTGVYDFQVLRPEGNSAYLVLGDTGNQTDPCDGQLHSYPVNIPVQTGDVIGAYAVDTWQGVLSTTSGSVDLGFISEPAVGDTITTSFPGPGRLDESATLLPPASALAATLVTASTGIGPGTALFHKASAIQIAVNSGSASTACADITDYLGLVNAQTGKKLSTTQAAQLTIGADNLAAALGCS